MLAYKTPWLAQVNASVYSHKAGHTVPSHPRWYSRHIGPATILPLLSYGLGGNDFHSWVTASYAFLSCNSSGPVSLSVLLRELLIPLELTVAISGWP